MSLCWGRWGYEREVYDLIDLRDDEVVEGKTQQFKQIWKGFIWQKIIIGMAKNQTVRKQDYILTMERQRVSCKFPSVSVDFNPIQKNGSQFEQIVPVFNKDKNYFTPSFVLKADQNFLLSSLPFEKLKFQERVRNSNQKNLPNPLSIAEPSSNYCQICQKHFDQYLPHINNVQHQIANRKSQANSMILELCTEYEIARKKTKPIRKDSEKTWVQDREENVRVLRSCRKKAKTEEIMGKNFSFISTKINTSHVNAL